MKQIIFIFLFVLMIGTVSALQGYLVNDSVLWGESSTWGRLNTTNGTTYAKTTVPERYQMNYNLTLIPNWNKIGLIFNITVDVAVGDANFRNLTSHFYYSDGTNASVNLTTICLSYCTLNFSNPNMNKPVNAFVLNTSSQQLYTRNLSFFIFPTGGISVDLLNPSSGTATTNSNYNFSVNVSGQTGSYEIRNSTFYLWYSNDSIAKLDINFTQTNFSAYINFTETNIPFSVFKWNVYSCGKNVTANGYACGWAATNFTFTRSSFVIVDNYSNANVYETDWQTYLLNVTTDPSILSLNSLLNYNGTYYTASTSCNDSGYCNISKSIDVPLVNGTATNHTFFWTLRTYDGTTSSETNTSNFFQSVNQTFVGPCATPANYSLNFTAYDEQNLTRINPYHFTGTFQTWLGHGTTYRFNNISSVSTAEQIVCISPKEYTFRTNADLAYNNATDSGYSTRNYYYRNATLINNSAQVFLYLLKQTSSTSFILSAVDANLIAINNTIIYSQRYYPGTNTYVTVQMALTDSNGKSVGFFETETVDYKFLLTKDGSVLKETEKRKVFPESSPFTLTFNVGSNLNNVFSQYQNLSNLLYTLEYNDTSKIATYTYIDTSGTTRNGRLLVQALNPSGKPLTICNLTSTQAAATIVCNVTGYNGTIIARGYISRSPEQIVATIQSFVNTARQVFGDGGLIMGIIILLAIGLITVYNPIVQIISLNVTLIILSTIGLLTLSPIFIFGCLAVSILIIVLLKQ